MQNDKPVALVLAGIMPHIDLIAQLKKRGFHTILVDYADCPPAKHIADEHSLVSALDVDAVTELATERKAKLIISTSGEGYTVACEASNRLGLSKPLQTEVIRNTSNKIRMKDIMLANDITTSKYVSMKKQRKDLIESLDYPLIVKPVDSYGSKGVRIIESMNYLNRHLNKAFLESRSGEVVVEELVKGDEYSVYCHVVDSIPYICLISKKIVMKDQQGETVLQNIGTIGPADIPKELYDKIYQNVQRIVPAFDLINTPLLVQVIIDDSKDEPFVIEVEPRLGGGLSHKIIQATTGFDILSAAIDSWLGKATHPPTLSKSQKKYLIVNIYTHPCKFKTIDGLEELKDQTYIDEYLLNKQSGAIISSDLSSSDRIAKVIISGHNDSELIDKFSVVLNNINVLDWDDNQVLKKEIYSDFLMK